jgi:hypothetical protein
MSRRVLLKAPQQHAVRHGMTAVVLALVVLGSGCRTASDQTHGSSAVNLDAEIARASNLQEPILLLVAESGLSRADHRARALFEALAVTNDGLVSVSLDLSISRNRAAATPYHITNTPVLLGLSPRGLIVSRDGTPVTKKLLQERINDVAPRGRELDAKFASLEDKLAKAGNKAAAQLELADFLLAHQNAREAIPHFAAVAHSQSANVDQRIRAWVDLVRAHLWIAEPEKGHHEAEDLLAVLGPKTAEARAGGNLVFGIQDANAKRGELARREFQAAIEAAPQSVYAKEAAEALAKLPAPAK